MSLWRDKVEECFPGCGEAAAVCMSAAVSLLIEDVTVCPAIVLVGPPSTYKTTVLDMYKLIDPAHPLDQFSSKAMISHFAAKNKEDLASKVDLLPQIKHKVVLVSDLAPFFSKRLDDLTESIGVLTRVLDGQGYISHSGVHGQRGEHGDFLFSMLAATTPISSSVWKVMGNLGPRLLFYEMPLFHQSIDDQALEMQKGSTYDSRLEECTIACGEHFNRLWHQHGGVGKLKWDRSLDSIELLRLVARLAELGVTLRGITAHDKVIGPSETEFTPALTEGPMRYRQSLYNLARGHALIEGRQHLEREDLLVPLAVVLSTGPVARIKIMQQLAEHNYINSIREASRVMGGAQATTQYALEQLIVLGLVANVGNGYTLSENYKWLGEMNYVKIQIS